MKPNFISTTSAFRVAALVGLAACGGETSVSSELFENSRRAVASRQDAENLAIELLGGRVLASEQDFERGRDVYEIEVMRPSGAVVEIEIEVSTGRVLEVEGHSLFPGDDLNVSDELLTLQQAITVALARQPGTVI
ncbi:MAG: PepSY domain-containing protein, partial [Myxococcota bacterium]